MRGDARYDRDDRSVITGAPREGTAITTPIPTGPRYLVGLDLGQAQDYTALVIAEQHGTPPTASYQIRHLERFALGTAYPAIVTHIQSLLQHPTLQRHTSLVVDATGCGRPVVDLLTQTRLAPVAVSIHGGDQVSHDGHHWRVPKRDLVSVLQVLLQARRLQVAEALPLAQVLVQELLNFRVTIDPRTAHDSYSAWCEGQHDDLVLATALACWWGERGTARPAISWL